MARRMASAPTNPSAGRLPISFRAVVTFGLGAGPLPSVDARARGGVRLLLPAKLSLLRRFAATVTGMLVRHLTSDATARATSLVHIAAAWVLDGEIEAQTARPLGRASL